MSKDIWEDFLDQEEKIIWQGKPDDRFIIPVKNYFIGIFGLFFGGFALFWMFGLRHFSIGVGIIAIAIFGDTFRRRRTWYTLTDRRALIATDFPIKGKSLKFYPITKDTTFDYSGNHLKTIYFASETKRMKNGTYEVQVGFEKIQDGASVFEQMRNIQRKL